ncbi:MAG: glycosyltransferase family 1 protein [Thermomicrobiales bacterium]
MSARVGLGVSHLAGTSGIRSVQRALLGALSRMTTDIEFVVVGEREDIRNGLVDGVFESVEVNTSQFIRLGKECFPVDVFHGLDYLIPLTCDIPVVASIHDTMMIRNVDAREGIAGTQRAIRMCAANADKIVVPSHYSAKCAVRDLGVSFGDVNVVRNGIGDAFLDDRYQRGASERWRNVVLYCGGYAPRKGVADLVGAFGQMWELMGGDVTLLCIHGSNLGKFESCLSQAAIGSGVPIHHYRPGDEIRRGILATEQLTDEDLAWTYSRATAMCYPSEEEGFGLPPVEAMAMGLPVVARRICALEETLTGAALLVDASDEYSFRDALIQVLTVPERRECMRREGLLRAQHFRSENMATHLIAVYKSLLDRDR